jgi:predicted secreted hydrolase
MNPQRRRMLGRMAASAALPFAWPFGNARAEGVQRGRLLAFPRDHGAHPETRTEWWYATGWVGSASQPTHGFQVTFFRSRTGLADGNASRFAARQLLFAHAAVTVLAAGDGAPGKPGQHLHDQRIARWSGDPAAALGATQLDGGAVTLQGWSLRDTGQAWAARVQGRDFALDLQLARTQPLLLQGEAGYSRKGPDEGQASHYLSEPQLATRGSLSVQGRSVPASAGQAWLDHEWSDHLLHPQAVGWDWIGINLFDGSALTAFVLRRADGSTLWAGGSWRRAGEGAQAFGPETVRFNPGRRWRSPSSAANYPVEWTVETPAGAFALRALTDAQELDGRGSTGTVYWEGLSELLDTQGRRVGLGYLEMTGYAGRLVLG